MTPPSAGDLVDNLRSTWVHMVGILDGILCEISVVNLCKISLILDDFAFIFNMIPTIAGYQYFKMGLGGAEVGTNNM